jgi:curved DNA-binding protein CbpA
MGNTCHKKFNSNYYHILGLDYTATKKEIHNAFRKAARMFHPDVNKDPNAEARFKEINEAYEIIGDETQRKLFDQEFGFTELKNRNTLERLISQNAGTDYPCVVHNQEYIIGSGSKIIVTCIDRKINFRFNNKQKVNFNGYAAKRSPTYDKEGNILATNFSGEVALPLNCLIELYIKNGQVNGVLPAAGYIDAINTSIDISLTGNISVMAHYEKVHRLKKFLKPKYKESSVRYRGFEFMREGESYLFTPKNTLTPSRKTLYLKNHGVPKIRLVSI